MSFGLKIKIRKEKNVEKLGFIFNSDKCIGCKACQVACKDKNKLELKTFFRKVETIKENNSYIQYSGACNHCENPACVNACPTNAMHISKDTTVQHTAGKCIGCGLCLWSCPYGAINFSKEKGIATKCDSCIDLRNKNQKPACVEACITHCLDFGVIDTKTANNSASYLPSSKITNPSLNIITKN